MSCAPCMAGLGASLNTYEGPVPPGVPNPYTVMLHSYPTRYHGPIYTRPMFGKPWSERPNDFALEPGFMGLGDEASVDMYRDHVFWPADMFKSDASIAAECTKDLVGLPDIEVQACSVVRAKSAAAARQALVAGLAVGALGTYLYMKRR